jgi:hypothetical protein
MAVAYTPNPLDFALVVEDATGLTNSNSYISLADANTYHSSGLYAGDWTGAASDDIRSRALAMATQVIDRTVKFRGWRKSTSQALEWPRYECPRRDVSEYAFVATVERIANFWRFDQIPDILKFATAELAKELLKGDRTADDPSKGIASLGIGQGAVTIAFNPSDRKNVFTDQVMNYLRQLGMIRGASNTVQLKRVQ